MPEEKTIDAYQVKDDETGKGLEWYGKYLWRGQWFECDEGFPTRAEAESDARQQLAYVKRINNE